MDNYEAIASSILAECLKKKIGLSSDIYIKNTTKYNLDYSAFLHTKRKSLYGRESKFIERVHSNKIHSHLILEY